MIGSFTYEEVLQFAKELKEKSEVIENLAKKHNIATLQSFISNVDWYSTFLKSTVDLYQDADVALQDLKKQK